MFEVSFWFYFILLFLKNFYCHVPKTIDDDDADPTTKKKQSKRKHQINLKKRNNFIGATPLFVFQVSFGSFFVDFFFQFNFMATFQNDRPRNSSRPRPLFLGGSFWGHAHFWYLFSLRSLWTRFFSLFVFFFGKSVKRWW